MLAKSKRNEDYYKCELLKMGFHKTSDGKQLVDLNLTELEQIYENEKFKIENKSS
ncbi:Fur-regulated basic protein FbpA [Fredinandcohnia sp. 179-A 10B2 NHS]|uniref:Fur-regulated basic protein FbpA n=1 Tax=Fredinandcohnia sp. 179-A 10B2 NHS TaxID=3235176 RepID=UPI0039A10D0F